MHEEKIAAIYHRDCIDGTTAAAVVLKKFPHAKLHPLANNSSKEELAIALDEIQGISTVYTVDCSIGVFELLEKGHTITTIDHHIGMKSRLEKLAKMKEGFTYVFDDSMSGASLSWLYFFPDLPEPEVISLVEDLDIWKWSFGNTTRDVNNYLSLLLNQPDQILPFFDGLPSVVKEKGATISQFTNTVIKKHVSVSEPLILHIGPYTIPGFNITDFRSETGNLLSEKYKITVALFTIIGKRVQISFRSLEDSYDPTALKLAEILNGGGHIKSAGAQVSLDDFLKMITELGSGEGISLPNLLTST